MPKQFKRVGQRCNLDGKDTVKTPSGWASALSRRVPSSVDTLNIQQEKEVSSCIVAKFVLR